MREFLIDSKCNNQRLDKYLLRILPNASSSFVYKMLRKKNITLNDKKADGKEILAINDSIKIYFSEDTFAKFSGDASVNNDIKKLLLELDSINCDIDIISENEDYIVINKPSNILSQKANVSDVSINEMALSYLKRTNQINEDSLKLFKPSIANRLDRNTSGLIFFAKSLHGAQYLADSLKARSLTKLYRCIVKGEIKEASLIDGYLVKNEKNNKVIISKNPVKEASLIKTEYKPIKTNGSITLLEVHLITGKSHQIRAHLASIGHPIIGDYKYGNRTINEEYKSRFGVDSQLLHSYHMILDNNKEYIAPLPKEFELIMGS